MFRRIRGVLPRVVFFVTLLHGNRHDLTCRRRSCSHHWGVEGATSGTGTPSGTMVLRIRQPNGSVTKVQIAGDLGDVPLSELLSSVSGSEVDESLQVSSSTSEGPLDMTKSARDLGLKHGTLLSVVDINRGKSKQQGGVQQKKKSTAKEVDGDDRPFDPFPELARQRFSSASRRARALANRKRGLTYADMEKMSSALHMVETQDSGVVKRIYMCSQGAERFAADCVKRTPPPPPKKKKGNKAGKKAPKADPTTSIQPRCSLLFGTVNRERDEQQASIARTSLSTPLADRKMCEVVKVHAVWDPPQQPGDLYDPSKLLDFRSSPDVRHAIDIAKELNLQPVGWIYSYEGKKGDAREDAQVPVLARDVLVAAKLQAKCMEHGGREKGGRFVTLALDVPTGSTEAFQISDQAVQMVAEGVLAEPLAKDDSPSRVLKDGTESRFIHTPDPVMVDSKEIHEVDCVLCLVNTAMLGHKGSVCGRAGVKGAGKLTSKTRKAILTSLGVTDEGAGAGGSSTLEILSDFRLLLALTKLLSPSDTRELCRLVQKWSRGQRKGTQLSQHLIIVLESVLSV